MIGSTSRRRWLVCWGVSLLLHTGFLTLGIVLLMNSVRFHVAPGKAAGEMNLVIESANEPPSSAPTPSPAFPPIRMPPPALKIFNSRISPMTQPSVPVLTPGTPAKSQPHKISPKLSPARGHAAASTKAVEAQPDELHNQPPDYPNDSRTAREQGLVILRVTVMASGDSSAVNILQSSGYFRLDQAAKRAVLHWKFHPATTAGIPVPSETDVPIHFRLQ